MLSLSFLERDVLACDRLCCRVSLGISTSRQSSFLRLSLRLRLFGNMEVKIHVIARYMVNLAEGGDACGLDLGLSVSKVEQE